MRSFPHPHPRRFATGLVATALVLVAGGARAESVIPLTSRLGPPVVAPAHRGTCGKFTDFGTLPFNPHTATTITEYLPLVTGCTVGGPTEAIASEVVVVPAFDFAKPSATCSAPGDFPGGAAWPTNGGLMSAARFQGFLNVPGPPGVPVKWTFFVAGNDSIRVTIGDTAEPTIAVNWYSKSWKAAEYVTFPEPGVYALDVTWATNHVCLFDSLELSVARSQIPGFDGATCLAPPGGGDPRPESQCLNAFVPTEAFEIVGEQLVMPSFDGGGSCFGCCADTDCAGATPTCLPTKVCGCQTDGDCSASPGTPFCDASAGRCRGCDTDAECSAGDAKAWCANAPGGSCTPREPNGEKLSSLAPVLASCTPENGKRACLTGVCSLVDQSCGALAGEICASDAQCRMGACAADGRCGAPNGESCTEDAACRNGTCATDGRCGSPNGGSCTENVECRTGTCAADGLCGAPNGGSCTENAGCRAGTCGTDGRCGALNGESCTKNAGCRTGACATDGLCGALNGGSCTTSVGCRQGLCAADICVACTATNLVACAGDTPACDVLTGTCVACTFSEDAAATSPLCAPPIAQNPIVTPRPRIPRQAPSLPPTNEAAAGQAGASGVELPPPPTSAQGASGGASGGLPIGPSVGSGGASPAATTGDLVLEGGSCQLAPASRAASTSFAFAVGLIGAGLALGGRRRTPTRTRAASRR